MNTKITNVPGRLHNVAVDEHGNPQPLTGANEIMDDNLGKDQETINSEVEGELSDLGSRVSDTEDALIAEKNRAQEAEATKADKSDTYTKAEVNNIASAFTSQKYATVEATAQTTAATDVLPATGATDTLYRVSMWDGNAYNPSVYSEYTWNGSAYVHMDTKSSVGEVFDITDYNSGTKYPDLAAALDGGNNIPQSLRKGGMSVKFVQSSDNKYIRYNLQAQSFTIDTTQWAIDDVGVYIDNPEWMKVITDNDDRVIGGIKSDGSIEWTKGIPTPIKNELNIIISKINTKVSKVEGKNLIDAEYAEGVGFTENNEYLKALLDSGKRILYGVQKDGNFYFGCDVPKQIVDYINKKETSITKKIEEAIDGLLTEKIIITVKKDGTGDFTNIQTAINSITDASQTKQYEVQVFDDWYVNDLTKLVSISNPTVYNDSQNPTSQQAFIVTKNYVSLKGMNGRREIYVENPNLNMQQSSIPNVQPIFVIGNGTIENFIFKIKGGRYAMHQDHSISPDGPDSFTHTIYKNIDAIHLGNRDYQYANPGSWWCGAGMGIANGQTQEYINCNLITHQGKNAFYIHSGPDFTQPCTIIIDSCNCIAVDVINSPSEAISYFGDRQSGQANHVIIKGSNFVKFNAYIPENGAIDDNIGTVPHTTLYPKAIINNVCGFGNTKMEVKVSELKTLNFKTKVVGEKISVTGGTAFDDVWGGELRSVNGSGLYGKCTGKNFILGDGVYSKVYNLAYILGNCSLNNKTLEVTITHTDNSTTVHTIIFNQNYMTADGSSYSYNTTPNISQSEIIDTINNNFGSYFEVSDKSDYIDTFDDCKEIGKNSGSSPILLGMALVKDHASGYKCWKKAAQNEKAEGVAFSDAASGNVVNVLLIDKNIFHKSVLGMGSVSRNTLYAVGSEGYFVSTNDSSKAVLIGLDDNDLISIN